MALTATTESAKGDFTQRFASNATKGGKTLAWTGVASATEDLVIDDEVVAINLTADGATANDFDLPAGSHGQEILVTLSVKGGAGNATLTPDAGVTIKQFDNTTAAASITFDAAAEYALVRYEYDHWVIVATNATVA